jgi:hypothetical protein
MDPRVRDSLIGAAAGLGVGLLTGGMGLFLAPLLGAGGGFAYGQFIDTAPANAPFTTLSLMSTQQSITAPRGKLIAIQAPPGGQVVTATPSTGFSGKVDVTGNQAYVAGATSGTVVVGWRDPTGAPQNTQVQVVVT